MKVEGMQAVTPADPFGPVRQSAMATDHGWVTERLQIDGRSVHYRRSVGGQGPPLVHIHGFAISGAYLMPTARLLARRWVNVVPDLPGYGLSERRDRVLGIPALARRHWWRSSTHSASTGRSCSATRWAALLPSRWRTPP